ncbi:hypothetical protein Metev_0625 [Methanohalobium evestigatum Z-7303]|uniref:Uncharacterized protein n=1 Tax=Methanohalobium evestigatum (strain ATCC BAA-1072 / DSM 3721 / NBRC 107634 / OCM 161 / Z-7303) TaxID=644295 RepID=D7E8I9_METEZ|nr:hypothetical protein [Methanohalobium evestigatum]ADI73531.1 hypothetical protein Metev_0625 [Methanohalobium evestigatum Z-7303]
MLGITWLSFNLILAIAGIMYVLDYFGMLRKIPLLNILSGRVPKNGVVLIVSFVLIGIGFGWISIGGLVDTDDGGGITAPEAEAAQTYSGDIKLMISQGDGTDFTDTSYDFYILDYSEYADKDKYEILQTVIDDGVSQLKAPGGGTPTASSTTDGAIERASMNAQVGQRFLLFGYNSETPASGEFEVIKESFSVDNYNENLGEFTVTPNRFQIYEYSSMQTVNFAGSNVSGYTETETSYTTDKTITFDAQPQNNYRIGDRMGLYVELPEDLKGNIDTITVSKEDGTSQDFTSFQKVDNLDTSDPIYESAPSAQNSANDMYWIGELPDVKRTSDSNKDPLEIKITYTHPGSGTNEAHFYGMQLVDAGRNLEIPFSQEPAFTLNATDSGSDGWDT